MGNNLFLSTTTTTQDGVSATFSSFSFNAGNYRNAYSGVYNSKPPTRCVVKISKSGKIASMAKKRRGSKRIAADDKNAKYATTTSVVPPSYSASADKNVMARQIADLILSQPENSHNDITEIVTSVTQSLDPTTQMMFDDAVVSNLARKCSLEFNKRKDGSSDSVKRPLQFNIPVLLKIQYKHPFLSANNNDMICVEPFITGKYHRFVSNNGTLLFQGTLGAFCHFSFHHSNGNFIIVDIQGVRKETLYELTDPAIHTAGKGGLFGELDLGDVGIDAFFLTHECNGLCRDLPRPDAHVNSRSTSRVNMKEKIMMKNGNFDPTKKRQTHRKTRASKP
ncbi:hypothetical protein TrLO_g2853 [Triparma laevis f. longispina]|uniref:Alpha-type protein kinase domain-containing protein n=1 Tax=Triparma laevis f. longispina TaxID=1714387 RepID=A0A9W7CI21_9STRA|nr:hypothetical protein TrLO_g2853 [Triparma laevis f. longispina]